MLIVTSQIRIPTTEFQWSFVRAGGPGGQNVNKVASKAVLRWNVVASQSLPADVKSRFLTQQANRITTTGDLVVASQRFRDQDKNRQDVLDRLKEWLLRATISPKLRKPTRPTRGSKERRLSAKKHRARVKTGRRNLEET